MSNPNNLKVIKVVLDKCPQKFVSALYGFQRSCNVLSSNIIDTKSRMRMKVCWFFKAASKIHSKCSIGILRSDKTFSLRTKVDIVAKNKLAMDKKIGVASTIDVSAGLLLYTRSAMRLVRLQIDLLAGKSAEIPAMVLKTVKKVKKVRILNQAHTKISTPNLKSRKRMAFFVSSGVRANNKLVSEKTIRTKSSTDILTGFRTRALSAMSAQKTQIGIFTGKSKEIPALVLKVFKIIKLQEYDGQRLMNIDSKTLDEMDFLVS